MSLVPTVYESTDPGAPQLTGQVGSLVALLDAVLVDGYGVGASRKNGAGWTREFSALNVRAYRGSLVSGSGYFLRIDDSATVGNARHGFARGYQSMTSASSGNNPVPASTQKANGVLLPKSITLDGTSRRWRVVANERFIYLFVDTRNAGSFFSWFAGDCISYKPGDMHGFVIACVDPQEWNGGYVESAYALSWEDYTFAPSESSCGLYVARSHTLAIGAVACNFFGILRGRLQFGGSGTGAYPSGSTMGLLYESVRFVNGAWFPRGELPGALAPMQQIGIIDSLPDGMIIEGLDGTVTDRVLVVRINRACNIEVDARWRGALLIRISGAWE